MTLADMLGLMIDFEELAAILESTPQVLEALLNPLDRAVLCRRPAHGEWSPLEVLGHLITVEGPAFRDRIRQMAEGATQVPEASGAGNGEDFQAADLRDLLDRFRIGRAESVLFVRSLSTEVLGRSAHHSTYGDLSIADFLHEWPYHDQDHLQQIIDSVKLPHLESMTANMRAAIAGGS